MNDRIKQLLDEAEVYYNEDMYSGYNDLASLQKFAELLLRNLAEELAEVAQGSKKVNPEWANGMYHAAMLAQRMTMDLPQWPEAE